VFVLDRREDFPRIVMGICAYGAIIDHARERSEYNLVDVPRPYRSIIRGKYSLESTAGLDFARVPGRCCLYVSMTAGSLFLQG
jgi:hypothetical protein